MNLLFVVTFFLLFGLLVDAEPLIYKKGDRVELYVNKVGPYWNPQETYHYYSLPVCRPSTIEHKSLTLGEVLDGDRMAKSLYKIQFDKNVEIEKLCSVTLSKSDIEKLQAAIEDFYYFEFIADEIPIRGFIGYLEENFINIPHTHNTHLYTHFEFTFYYNQDRIIFANVSTRRRPPTKIDSSMTPAEITFTYGITWEKSKTYFVDRNSLLRSIGFFPKSLEVHWLSIVNSIVLVFLLLGFVVIILSRIIRNDFLRYNNEKNDSLDDEDYGWKLISNDVFRFPVHKSLFCAVLGVGSQFLALAAGILFLALFGLFNVHKHGSLSTAAVILFALTSSIAGFISSRVYKQMNGDAWVWNVNLTACLYTIPFFFTWSTINSVAWYYGSTQALPFSTIIVLLLVWTIIGYPLTVVGAIIGKNMSYSFDAPCRTKNICREIPPLKWYRGTLSHMIIGGFLPFSAISVELYYIFSTIWGREQYTLYGILTVVFILLLCVTACISISLTYFQLAAEDYRWWWRSIFTAGSTGIFIFGYATFFYLKRSNMSGGLQTLQFFGYTALGCYMFFLMLGTIGYFSSLKFIRYIYFNIKLD